jgi:hypothetical protein
VNKMQGFNAKWWSSHVSAVTSMTLLASNNNRSLLHFQIGSSRCFQAVLNTRAGRTLAYYALSSAMGHVQHHCSKYIIIMGIHCDFKCAVQDVFVRCQILELAEPSRMPNTRAGRALAYYALSFV